MSFQNLHTTHEIKTVSGLYVNVFDPQPHMFSIYDIAHALSNVCRFGGHTPDFYSVAEHSVLVTHKVDSLELKKQALLHDATEAYLMDIPKPIKRHLKEYNVIEDKLMAVIAKKFGIQYPFSEEIKKADMETLEWEWEHVIQQKQYNDKGYSFNFFPQTPNIAKELFLYHFESLFKGYEDDYYK